MIKYVMLAHSRGRESLKFVPTDPQFPAKITVDARSGVAKIVVTDKATQNQSEQNISATILADAPQPTIVHSLTVSYNQCLRDLKWK